MKEQRIIATNLEYRNEDNAMYIEGYAATFEQPTVLYEYKNKEYKEVIARNAFDNTNMKDVVLRYNHNDTYPILARTRGGSLSLEVDNIGLKVKAKLFDTRSSEDVYNLVKQGALDKMSFAFTVSENGSTYDSKTLTRSITDINRLYDVAIVDVPAYESTSVQARKFFDEQAEIEDQKTKIEREKIKLKIELSL